MQAYADKNALLDEIQKNARLYIREFDSIAESDKDLRLEEAERTPYESLTYQLGWLALIQQWEREEAAGRPVAMPAPGIKWNQMAPLHQRFYAAHNGRSLADLTARFEREVAALCDWLDTLDDEVLFQPGGRQWAQSTPSNWPVWKWVHINTVAPFKSFRAKLRKWKKQRAAGE